MQDSSRSILIGVLIMVVVGSIALAANLKSPTGNFFNIGWFSNTPQQATAGTATQSPTLPESTQNSEISSLKTRVAALETRLNSCTACGPAQPAPVPPAQQKCCYYLGTRSLSAGERTPYGSNYLDDTAARNFYIAECPRDSRQVSQAICVAKDPRYTQFDGCRWRC